MPKRSSRSTGARRSPQPRKQPANKKKKKKYYVRNWPAYNEMLKQRGNIEVWAKVEEILECWHAEPSGKRGAQQVYSDFAITFALQLGLVFGQRLRQAEGMTASLFRIMGTVLPVPNYSTLSRRGASVTVSLLKTPKERVVLVIDSTGLKVYGEGEWKVRTHGWSKRRTWRKFQAALTPDGEFRAVALTENSVGDSEVVGELLDQEPAVVDALAGDGIYDTRNVYDLCGERAIADIRIPPQENAKIWNHGNSHAPPHPRDENLRQIRKTSRSQWKEAVGYHVRSCAENGFFRFKTIFGDRLNARKLPQQVTEAGIKASILNRMWQLGMPESCAVA